VNPYHDDQVYPIDIDVMALADAVDLRLKQQYADQWFRELNIEQIEAAFNLPPALRTPRPITFFQYCNFDSNGNLKIPVSPAVAEAFRRDVPNNEVPSGVEPRSDSR
jgi:hypothetical protein